MFYTRIPVHAAIGETVQVTRNLGKAWARGLVNGVLRNAQRQSDALHQLETTNQNCSTSHPDWLVNALQTAWPDHWQQIIHANNKPPPMSLRVNGKQLKRERYLKLLLDNCIQATSSPIAPECLTLSKPVSVNLLPQFATGGVSVQDESAQLAAKLLPIKSGDRV